jgi:hypothetical protein
MTTLTVLTPGEQIEVDADVDDGSVLVGPEALDAALGWRLEPEGLCRGDVCVPAGDDSGVRRGDRVDLVATTALLGCASLLDAEASVLAVGVPRDDRRRALQGREAPDFTLPDLDGVERSLEAYRDHKRLLVAFASW